MTCEDQDNTIYDFSFAMKGECTAQIGGAVLLIGNSKEVEFHGVRDYFN